MIFNIFRDSEYLKEHIMLELKIYNCKNLEQEMWNEENQGESGSREGTDLSLTSSN